MTIQQIANHALLTYLARRNEAQAILTDVEAGKWSVVAHSTAKLSRTTKDAACAVAGKTLADRHVAKVRILRAKAACYRMEARRLRMRASVI